MHDPPETSPLSTDGMEDLKATNYRFANSPTVTLFVGPKGVGFIIHESILFEASPVLKAAFGGRFKEAGERTMDLPEEDDTLFEYFLEWIYSSHLKLLPVPSTPRGTDLDSRVATAMYLYILAEKYDIVKLRNEIVRQLFHISKAMPQGPTQAAVEHVLNNTARQSKMWKLLVDWYAWYEIPTRFAENHEFRTWLMARPEFHIDTTYALAQLAAEYERKSYYTDDKPFSSSRLSMYLEEEQEAGKK